MSKSLWKEKSKWMVGRNKEFNLSCPESSHNILFLEPLGFLLFEYQSDVSDSQIHSDIIFFFRINKNIFYLLEDTWGKRQYKGKANELSGKNIKSRVVKNKVKHNIFDILQER